MEDMQGGRDEKKSIVSFTGNYGLKPKGTICDSKMLRL